MRHWFQKGSDPKKTTGDEEHAEHAGGSVKQCMVGSGSGMGSASVDRDLILFNVWLGVVPPDCFSPCPPSAVARGTTTSRPTAPATSSGLSALDVLPISS